MKEKNYWKKKGKKMVHRNTNYLIGKKLVLKLRKIQKRLVLNKQTVANLNVRTMKHVLGGATADSYCMPELGCGMTHPHPTCPIPLPPTMPPETCEPCPETDTCVACAPGTEYVGCVAVD